MSILISLTNSLFNKFQNQIVVSSKINQDINEFNIIRSNLREEFYLSDSILFIEDTIQLFKKGNVIKYYSKQNNLYRGMNRREIKCNNSSIKLLRIFRFKKNLTSFYVMIFQFGGGAIVLQLSNVGELKKNIDNHYLNL